MSEVTHALRPNSHNGIKIAGVILLISYICLFVCIGAFTVNQIDASNQPALTPIPTIAVTPQILVNPPDQRWRIKQDDFSSNIREWSILFYKGKIEIINGNLILQGYFSDQIVIGTASSLVVPSAEKYYAQADFSTDTKTFFPYGLVFGLDYSLGSFYVFEIDQQTRTASVYRHTGGQWSELAEIKNAPISPFPEPNTLSVLMENGKIDLYINGEPIYTCHDENPLQSTHFGVYTSGNEARVIIDNFFIYDAK